MKSINDIQQSNPRLQRSVLPFEVQEIRSANRRNSDHCREQFEIIWVVKGNGSKMAGLQDPDSYDNRIFCVKPGQQHSVLLHEITEGFIISFTEAFLSIGELEFDFTCQTNLFQLFLKQDGMAIKNELVADLKEIVLKMMKEHDNGYLFKTEVLKRYLKIFLIYLTRHFGSRFETISQSRNMEMVKEFMRLLDMNYKNDKMVTEYAAQLCVTPNYLNEVVKRVTGYSAGHHIRQRVVLEAKRMALYSDRNMKAIAYELGFADPGHFSKFFKAVTGRNFTNVKRDKIALSIAL